MSKRQVLIYELTMIILAIVSIILVILKYIGKIALSSEPYVYLIDIMLIVFFLDYLIRLAKAKNKKRFFKNNIFDLLSIMPFNPIFMLFRINRLVGLIKVFEIFGWNKAEKFCKKIQKEFRSLVRINGLIYLLYTSLGIIFISSTIYSYAENESLTESFWWAASTVTTVGYGDIAPHTMAGKLAAILLMFVGIGFIGMLTSSITNYFTDGTDTDKLDEVLGEIKALKKQNDNLTQKIESLEKKIDSKNDLE